MGHIEPTTSKHNTPILVIPKRLGHYRLLQDLHAVNDHMEKKGVHATRPPTP